MVLRLGKRGVRGEASGKVDLWWSNGRKKVEERKMKEEKILKHK